MQPTSTCIETYMSMMTSHISAYIYALKILFFVFVANTQKVAVIFFLQMCKILPSCKGDTHNREWHETDYKHIIPDPVVYLAHSAC